MCRALARRMLPVGMHNTLLIAFLLVSWFGNTLPIKCTKNQKLRYDLTGDPICCFNVTCEEGTNQIPKPCQFHGGADTCTKCPENTCNAARVNSMDIQDFSGLCISTYKQCDTSSSAGGIIYQNDATCEVICKCDRKHGFIKFHPGSMECVQSGTICRNTSEWLNDTGECVACKAGFKQDEKYGECIIKLNKTFWPTQRTSTEISKILSTETTKGGNVTAIPDAHRGGISVGLTAGISVAGIVVIGVVLIGVVLRLRTVSLRNARARRYAADVRLPPSHRVNEPFLSEATELDLIDETPDRMADGGPNPSANGAPDEMANGGPNPSANGAPDGMANGGPNPSANGAPGRMANGGPNSSANGAPSRMANGGPNPSANGAPDGMANGGPNPSANG